MKIPNIAKAFKITLISSGTLLGVCLIILGCFILHLNKEMKLEHEIFNGDEAFIYRESTLLEYEWQHMRKHFYDDIRHKRIDWDIVYSIMETEGVSIEKMGLHYGRFIVEEIN